MSGTERIVAVILELLAFLGLALVAEEIADRLEGV